MSESARRASSWTSRGVMPPLCRAGAHAGWHVANALTSCAIVFKHKDVGASRLGSKAPLFSITRIEAHLFRRLDESCPTRSAGVGVGEEQGRYRAVLLLRAGARNCRKIRRGREIRNARMRARCGPLLSDDDNRRWTIKAVVHRLSSAFHWKATAHRRLPGESHFNGRSFSLAPARR